MEERTKEDKDLIYLWRTNNPELLLLTTKQKLRLRNMLIWERDNEK